MPTKTNLQDFEEHLNRLNNPEFLIIVEGKKDKEALLALGIENTFSLDKWPLYKVVEHVAKITKDCVILTDLDFEGKKLYGTLNSGLQDHGVRIDNAFRNFLFRHTSLRQIEGIDTFYHRLQNIGFHNV